MIKQSKSNKILFWFSFTSLHNVVPRTKKNHELFSGHAGFPFFLKKKNVY